MDKYRIIELVMIAVLTIVTTAVVTRLSLNKGRLGVTSKLKSRFTPKFRAYMKVIFSALIVILSLFYVIADAFNPSPPTRSSVLLTLIYYTAALTWLSLNAHFLRKLLDLKAEEKAQREREQWQPLIDTLKETTTSLREAVSITRGDAESPLDKLKGSIVDRPSDSQNPKE